MLNRLYLLLGLALLLACPLCGCGDQADPSGPVSNAGPSTIGPNAGVAGTTPVTPPSAGTGGSKVGPAPTPPSATPPNPAPIPEAGAAPVKKVDRPEPPLDKVFADFSTKDLAGKPFSLSAARKVSKEDALAAVVAAAKAAGAAEAKPTDLLASMPGLQGEGDAIDADARRTFLQAAASPFGLVAGPETGASWKTLGEVADWIAGSAEAPILLVVWSSKCPTSKEYEPRILEIVAETGTRVFPLASSGQNETDEDARGYVEAAGLPYRVLWDRDQVVADRLGGYKTPHVFLLDGTNRLRYAGAVDDDPTMEKEDRAARKNYLLDAILAVKEGRDVETKSTPPKG